MYLCGHFNLLDISDILSQIDWLGDKPNANPNRNKLCSNPSTDLATVSVGDLRRIS